MRNFLIFLLAIVLLTAIVLYLRYGGGDPYQGVMTEPLVDSESLETAFSYTEPIGSVAVSDDGRIFFSVHPEARAQGNKLLEWVDGAAQPYPGGSVQPHLFTALVALSIDRHSRLWAIDHGNQGFGDVRLLAFDLRSGELVHDHTFDGDAAPVGSYFHDLRVTRDGEHVIIADSSVLRKRPALVVYDIATRHARRLLESHDSLAAGGYLPRYGSDELTYLGGLFTLQGGVSGVGIDRAGQWLYYGAFNQDRLYRVPVADLVDPLFSAANLEAKVEYYSDKPLSDGVLVDAANNLYVTDIEHNAVSMVGDDRQPVTLVRSQRLRWPDGITQGPGGYFYVADSALPELILQTRQHIRAQGPYAVFRFRRSVATASER